jgi:tight adherence protein B
LSILSMFFIVLVAAFAVVAFFTEPSRMDKLINARLVSLDRKISSTETDEFGIVKEVTFSKIPALDRFLRNNRFAGALQLLIDQGEVHWTVGRFIFFTLLLICVGAVLGNWWIAPGLLGWLPGCAFAALPYLFLVQKRKNRLRRFAAILPSAIDLMSRGLRAGQALPATVETVAQETEEPVRTEFRRTADEQSFGLPFREALLKLSDRVPIPDLQFLVTAILVQKETGGNLAQVLDKTARVIRERERVEGQMRIRTAQGRLTGWILCLLPFAMFAIMNLLNPGYGKVLFEEPLGQKLVLYAGILMVIGVFAIRKIVNIKV